MIKNYFAITLFSIAAYWAEVVPTELQDYEKIGIITTLIFAIAFLIHERKTEQKKMQENLNELNQSIQKLGESIDKLQETNSITLDRMWDIIIKNEKKTDTDS